MKKLSGIFLLTAMTAMLGAGCTKTDENNDQKTPGGGDGTPVRFYAQVDQDDETRANLIIGDSKFTGEWEADDAMGVISYLNGQKHENVNRFYYNGTSFAFEGDLPSGGNGAWKYHAFYPHAEVTHNGNEATAHIPFGNYRTQSGKSYNSNYDALVAEAVTCEAADPGKTSDGKTVTFSLKRLVSILNFNATGGNSTDQVSHVLLTAKGGETISAASLDFEIGKCHEATASCETGASNVIAVEMQGTVAANDLNAFINVPSGDYTTFTFDVITEGGQMGSITVDRTGKPLEAGKLYKKEITGMTFEDIPAPSLNWEDQNMDEIHDIEYEEDESGAFLSYPAAIDITVPGGIKSLEVEVTSDFLNELGISTLDLFNDTEIPGLDIPYASLNLKSGPEVQYKKSIVFDITSLVPLIPTVGQLLGMSDPGSEHIFNIKVTDLAGQTTEQALTFVVPSTEPNARYDKNANLWANTASFTLKNIPEGASSVTVSYKKSTEATWQTAAVEGNTAKIAPEWESSQNAGGMTVYSVKAGTGVFAEHTYDYKLTVDGSDYTGRFSTAAGNEIIPNGDMSGWTETSATGYEPYGAGELQFWGCGNNTMTKSLCTYDDDKFGNAAASAKMASAKAPLVSILAAGNLFVGSFRMASTYTGEVSFGKPYGWTARPNALRVSYHAKVGNVDRADGTEAKIAIGQKDKSRIFFCIVNWKDPHIVSSTPKISLWGASLSSAKLDGAWDPERVEDLEEGQIIGYGSTWIDESTNGDEMITTDIEAFFYDQVAKPEQGNYSLVISCACNAYGDYFNGCSSNVMYVDDFEWIY